MPVARQTRGAEIIMIFLSQRFVVLVALGFIYGGLSLSAFAATALDVQVKFSRTQYMQYEPLIAEVKLTNRTGRSIILTSNKDQNWLSFVVNRSHNESVSLQGKLRSGEITLEPGQSAKTKINLVNIYEVSRLGSYKVYAIVRYANIEGRSYKTVSSGKGFFQVAKGRSLWSAEIGLSKFHDEYRRYNLLTFHDGNSQYLYLQIENPKTNIVLSNRSLGKVLLYRKPDILVDLKNHLHLLYRSSPLVYRYLMADGFNRVVKESQYKRLDSQQPQLAMKDSKVEIHYALPYDEKLEQDEKSRFRKLSERPTVVY